MAKVVTEKPRSGRGWGNEKHGGRVHRHEIDRERNDAVLDDGVNVPLHQSTSALKAWSRHRNKDCKQFSDLLGPLKGYLRKQVGRPWDVVYSELSATLDKRSLTGRHIWGHVRDEISLHCYVGVSGRIWEFSRWGFGSVYEVAGLYVHPWTGLVCWAPERRYRHTKPVDPDLKKLDAVTDLVRVKGIWYRYEYGFVDRYVPARIGPTGYVYRDGYFEQGRVLQRKKQLSRKELKQQGVVNDLHYVAPPPPTAEPSIIRRR